MLPLFVIFSIRQQETIPILAIEESWLGIYNCYRPIFKHFNERYRELISGQQIGFALRTSALDFLYGETWTNGEEPEEQEAYIYSNQLQCWCYMIRMH